MVTQQPQEGSQAETEVLSAQDGSPSLLDTIIRDSRIGGSEAEKSRARDLIGELADQVLSGTVVVKRDLATSLDARIAELDNLISEQLNAILHHPEFQRLEASWRGLKYLVSQTETSSLLKIKVLNASKAELSKDFRTSPDYDQSVLFKKIYEEEFGTFGGEPYGAFIGDYEFSKHPDDFNLLEEIARVASAAHAPFVSAASSSLFGLESFAEIGKPRNLAKLFETTEYMKWKSFREAEDSRYVGLVLPHVLGRLPYGPETSVVEEFNFTEDVDGTDNSKYLWMNAAYAYGARLTNGCLNIIIHRSNRYYRHHGIKRICQIAGKYDRCCDGRTCLARGLKRA